jgi:beta,beta-carotene 9',10'-dioxygenase
MKISLLTIQLACLWSTTSAFIAPTFSGTKDVNTSSSTTSRRRSERNAIASAVKEEASAASTKEELFVKWMATDSLEEVFHPGNKLKVQGSIPSYVKGSYVKNGPGAFSVADGSRRYTHAFDGLAKLQKFDVDGNDVTFTTRFIDSCMKKNMLDPTNPRMPPHVSTGPIEPPFPMMDVILNTMSFDNTCVNFEEISSSGTFCAVTDAAIRNEIDINTLETVRRIPDGIIDGALPLITQFSTAHSKVAKRDGLTYNYYLEMSGLLPFQNNNWAHIVRTNPDLSQTSIGKVPVDPDRSSYVHEISVTDNYAILVLHPLFINLGNTLAKGALLANLDFDPTVTTKIHLFPLAGVDESNPVRSFEAPACWAYHHVNAYEDGTTVNLDMIAYEDGSMSNGPHGYLYMDNMKTEENRMKQAPEGSVWRFTMDLKADNKMVIPEKKVIYTTNDNGSSVPQTMELISVAPACQGKPYRYVYGFTGFYQAKAGYMDWAIVKQDVTSAANDDDHKSNTGLYWYEEYMYPGEVTFVPNPDGSGEEDDGALLSTVYDSQRGDNFLLVLDAVTMKELARAYTGIGL